MAEAAVTFLLEQVKEVIVTYNDLISNAAKEFDLLNNDLDGLRAILKDMDNSSTENNQMRQTEKEIREVVYEVEDTVDSWLTQMAASKGKRGFRRSIGLDPKKINLAKEVQSLRNGSVKKMLEKAKTITSAKGPKGTEELSPNKDPIFRQEKVVGFEDEEATLTGYLTEVKTGLDIISIIGMPGLGKSTLAWKIFHDQRIGYEFPIRIWVHVSQRFNFRAVCLKILKTFSGGKDMSSMSDQELSTTVHACLKEEKFLLVMDDVWKLEDWDAFKNVLPYGNGKGKVLITSRILDVGRHAKQITDPHELRFLRLDESWELLQLEVFGNPESCPDKLMEIGKHIADKCGGVPLTIVVMGGILKNQLTKKNPMARVKNEWENMSKKVTLANKEAVITNLVKTSYDGLSYHMREPFMYLGVFPDDYEIPTWTLTRLWIAEGFIQPKEDRSLEETAEEILDHLISRNLLIASKKNPLGEVKICRVHDMIREFCRMKAEEKNLFKEITMVNEGASADLATKLATTHRLCLHSHLSEFFATKVKGPCVRSFLCFQKESTNLNPTYISSIPESFELLRILHSKTIRFNQFPQKVTTLNHLRYIILCVDDLKILPEPISQLWNLQTIVVDTKARTLTSKANIWKMIRLRHFKTKAAIVLDTTSPGEAGKNLQALTRVSVPESSIADISKRACHLKTLGIRGELAKLFEGMSLEKFISLENMKLENELQFDSISENPLPRLPDWNRFPQHLKRLTLSNTYLDWSHMSSLAGIPELEVLKLKQNAFTGITWEADRHVFSKLQYLLIVNADLVVWELSSTETFPSLSCLVLKNCEKLNAIPNCLDKHLDKLEVDRVRISVVESARKIEEVKRKEKSLKKSKWVAPFKLFVGATCDQAQK